MKRILSCLAILAAMFSTPAMADLSNAQESLRTDLEDALSRFAELQEKIKDEKIPLAKDLNDVKARVSQLRRDAERAQRLKDNSTVDIGALEDRVEKRLEQINYVGNLVNDFGERFQRDLSLSEVQVYENELNTFRETADRVLGDDELAKGQRLIDQLFILKTSVERFERLIGGDIYPGQAVVNSGEVEDGKFLAIGPTTYFASDQSESAGLTLKAGALPPVVGLSPVLNEQVRTVVQSGGTGVLPIDPSLGSALAIAAQEDTLWEHVQKGGIWIWPILFFAFLAAVTALFKVFEIYSVKMPEAGVLHDILKALNDGKRDEALALAQAVAGPSRQMLVDAVEHSDESKELIEEVMYERMLEVQPKLERMLPFIAVTAATAPLMGLLGTVTGMINTFKLITIFGTGDAKQLSSGISEALVTTEFGLIVAIPSLIVHALLNRRAQGVMASMERMAVAFINGLVRKN